LADAAAAARMQEGKFPALYSTVSPLHHHQQAHTHTRIPAWLKDKRIVLAAVITTTALLALIVALGLAGHGDRTSLKVADTPAPPPPTPPPPAPTPTVQPIPPAGKPAGQPKQQQPQPQAPQPQPQAQQPQAQPKPQQQPQPQPQPQPQAQAQPALKPQPVAQQAPKPQQEPKKSLITAVGDPPKLTVAERNAFTLYKERRFDAAVAALRTAADIEKDRAAADRMTQLANDYSTVGAGVARGDQNADTNPAVAMLAYQGALDADLRVGRSSHGAWLRTQLAKVAPRAALVYMSANRWEQARAACDIAVDYGSGHDANVTRVRAQLEVKAKEMIVQASGATPTEANALYRRVLKIVPATSPWYGKAYATLNKGRPE
jgi:hypothetical protein